MARTALHSATLLPLVIAAAWVLATPARCHAEELAARTKVATAPDAQCPANSPPPVRRVGDAGDLRRVELIGMRQCDLLAVRRAMLRDLELQAAARPSAELTPFLDVLEERLAEGYRHSGFLDAVVDVSYDPVIDVVTACIHEGQLYTMRDVRITGGTAKVRKALGERLTQSTPPRPWSCRQEDALQWAADFTGEELPLWRPSETVRADWGARSKLQQQVRRHLADLGRFAAEFTVELRPDRGRGRADLVVEITSLGPAAAIRTVEIAGLSRHSHEQVLGSLGVSAGDPLDAATLSAIYRKLRESCRFWQYEVGLRRFKSPSKMSKPAASSEGVVLALKLREYQHVAALDEPLSEIDAALARLAVAASHDAAAVGIREVSGRVRLGRDDAQSDSSAEGRPGAAEATFAAAADKGWLLEARGRVAQAADVDHAILAMPRRATVYDWRGDCRLQFNSPVALATLGRLEAKIEPSESSDGQYRTTGSLRATASSAGLAESSGQVIRLNAEPVALVHLAHRPDSSVEIQGRRATVASGMLQLTFDLDTGQVETLSLKFAGDFGEGEVFAANGEFDKAVRRLERKGARLIDKFDPEAPIASSVAFAAESLERQPFVRQRPALVALCRQAAAIGNDDWFRRHANLLGISSGAASPAVRSRPPFSMPAGLHEEQPRGDDQLLASLAQSVPTLADALFPRGSWPWTLARETSFAYARERTAPCFADEQRSLAELNRIARAPNTGPIGLFAAAQLAGVVASPTAASQIQKRAGEHLDTSQFRPDVRLAAYGDHGFAQATRAVFETYAAMPTQERAAIAEELPAPWGGVCEVVAERINEAPERSIGETIEAALLEAWNDGLREIAASQVRELGEVREARVAGDELQR